MSVVAYPEAGPDIPGRRHRVGGFYSTVQEIEAAADKLEFHVIVPPACREGYFMIPHDAVTCERCFYCRYDEDTPDLATEVKQEECVGEGGHFWRWGLDIAPFDKEDFDARR